MATGRIVSCSPNLIIKMHFVHLYRLVRLFWKYVAEVLRVPDYS